MTAPTDVEKELIRKFKDNVSDILVTEEHKAEPFLMRWIRARDYDLDKAETMIRNSFKWREDNNVDKILIKTIDPWFSLNFPFWHDGVDKQGHPVVEMPLGSWDLRKAMDGGVKEEELGDHISFYFETILQRIRESNKDKKPGEFPNTQWTCIVDWKGYSYAQLMHWRALQNTLRLAATYEAHYPEVLFKAYFINCPSVFPLMMALMKQVLVPKTVGKITCLSNRADWEPLIHQEVDKDQLGTLYGGTRVRMLGDKEYDYNS